MSKSKDEQRAELAEMVRGMENEVFQERMEEAQKMFEAKSENSQDKESNGQKLGPNGEPISNGKKTKEEKKPSRLDKVMDTFEALQNGGLDEKHRKIVNKGMQYNSHAANKINRLDARDYIARDPLSPPNIKTKYKNFKKRDKQIRKNANKADKLASQRVRYFATKKTANKLESQIRVQEKWESPVLQKYIKARKLMEEHSIKGKALRLVKKGCFFAIVLQVGVFTAITTGVLALCGVFS